MNKDTFKEKLDKLLFQKLDEINEHGRAKNHIKKMFEELDVDTVDKYRFCINDFLIAHNIAEIAEMDHFKYLNYEELRKLRDMKKQLKLKNSPYYAFIKDIQIPYRNTLNVEMITDIRYDYMLRLINKAHSIHPNQFDKTYKKILQRTIDETNNLLLKSKLKLYYSLCFNDDLEEMLEK